MEYKGMKEDERFISVTPSKRQIAYQNMEYFCFIHFTVNTFTGSEWGLGDEPESNIMMAFAYGQASIQNIVLKIHLIRTEKVISFVKQQRHVKNMV